MVHFVQCTSFGIYYVLSRKSAVIICNESAYNVPLHEMCGLCDYISDSRLTISCRYGLKIGRLLTLCLGIVAKSEFKTSTIVRMFYQVLTLTLKNINEFVIFEILYAVTRTTYLPNAVMKNYTIILEYVTIKLDIYIVRHTRQTYQQEKCRGHFSLAFDICRKIIPKIFHPQIEFGISLI